MLDLDAVFRQKSNNFVARKFETEMVLIPLVNNVADMTSVLTLNEVGSSIFNLIDGKNSINTIILKLIEEYSVEIEVLQADVEQFIAQAQSKNLIEKVESSTPGE